MTVDIYRIWPMIVGGLMGFAWFIRLEAKVLYMDKDLKRGEKIHTQLTDDMHEVKLCLTRIEEHLKVKENG